MNGIIIHASLTLKIFVASGTHEPLSHEGPTDLGVKMGKNSGIIKGRFYVTTSLSDSWEDFTPLHAGATLGRLLH